MTESALPPTQIFHITGIDCADCARGIERGVCRLDGVQTAALNFATATLKVEGAVAPEAVAARVQELGYGIGEETAQQAPAARPVEQRGLRGFVQFLLRRRETTMALVGLVLILPGVLFNELLPMLGAAPRVFDLTSVLALVVAGYPIALSAWRSLKVNHEVNINVLMTIAAVGAVLIGAYTEAGLVMVLFALGEALEGYTVERARHSISTLIELAPAEATLLGPCIDCREHLGREGYTGGPCPFCGLEEKTVPVGTLQIGDTVLVKPGERIPMDGIVIAGTSSANQAPITGESLPVDKGPGAEVFAGAINGEGALQIEVTRLAQDNTISRVIRLVEEAQEQRAPVQRFVDRFAAVYTPAVMVLAAAVALLSPLLFGLPFLSTTAETGSLYRAFALLVVACPCALVISTPVSLISAISAAARQGVLIKGGAYLEAFSRVSAIAFDKTGTLTTGQLALARVRSVDCEDEVSGVCGPCDDLLDLAGSLERHSAHPLARAIVAAQEQRRHASAYAAPEAVQALAGRGLQGVVAGRRILLGSHAYFDKSIPHAEHCDDIASATAQGQTAVLVSSDDRYQGYLTLTDTPRPGTHEVMEALRQEGIEALVMLTGDEAATAAGVAVAIGVTDVRANLLPEDKVTAVRGLMDRYGAVAMVGDGINDAPALATATVGIAMGAAGSAQALETADIALMSDDLARLPFGLRLSRAGMRTIRINVALSLAIKAVFLVLVLSGVGTMWMAVFADMGASLLVTLNGMRLLRFEAAPAPAVGK